jgi:Cys-rich protein (TIGR01571 family)
MSKIPEKEMVPLVVIEARPVISEEDPSAESPVVSVIDEEQGKASKVKVSLVATTALPPGYRLPITYREGGKTVSAFCRIPSNGVYEGQEFEAEIIAPRVVQGVWAAGIFDCGSMRDTAFTMLSCCCTAVAWGCLYESAFKKPSGSCWVILLVLTVVYNISYFVQKSNPMLEKGGKSNFEEGDFLALLVTILSWTMILAVTRIRAKIRQKHQIGGNYCEDCLCATFCGCCTAIQAYQHLERNQENPRLLPLHEQKATLIV